MRTDIIGIERSEAHAILRLLQKTPEDAKDPMLKHMESELNFQLNKEGKGKHE